MVIAITSPEETIQFVLRLHLHLHLHLHLQLIYRG
jgi:hypothetical protein